MKRILYFLVILAPLLADAQVWTIPSTFDTVALASVNNIYRSWGPFTALDAGTGALQVNGDSTASPTNTTTGQLQGGSYWKLTRSDTSYIGIVIKQMTYSAPNQSLIFAKSSTFDNNGQGYRIRLNKDAGAENIQLQRFTAGTSGTTLANINLTSAAAVNDTLYMKIDSANTYTAYYKHKVSGVIDSVSATDATYNVKTGWYIWVRGLVGATPPIKLKSLLTAPLVRKAPPPPPTTDSMVYISNATIPAGTLNQPPIIDSLQFQWSLQDLFSNITKVVFRKDGVRVDSVIGLNAATVNVTSKRLAAGNRGVTHTYDVLTTSAIPNTFTSPQKTYLALGDSGVTWTQVPPILSLQQDSVQLRITGFDYYGIKYILAFKNGTQVDSIWYGLTPVVQTASPTSKKLAAGTLNITQLYFWRAVTDSGLTRTSPTFSYTPTDKKYYHTVHLANWEEGDIPADSVPYRYVTHIIMFAGKTGGSQTCLCAPGYYQAPNTYTDSYTSRVRTLCRQNGVKLMMDFGFNQSSDYCNVANAAGGIQIWAGTVGHYMVNNDWDGGDFDLEGGGCYADISLFAKYLHDTLAVLNPSKKYDLTTSIMWNTADINGWHVPQAVAGGWLDQVNSMWYDYCFPIVSSLYPSSTHSCFSNDSAVAFSYAAQGIPRNKIGLGYAIQVYNGCGTCYAKFAQVANTIYNGTHFFDNEAKVGWSVLGGSTVSYQDSISGFYRADFIKRNGFGGAMGFCLGRGYSPNPPAGVNRNLAAYGMGMNLLGVSVPPPLVLPPNPLNPPGGVADTNRAKDTTTFVWSVVSGASMYQILVANNVNFTNPIVNVNTQNAFYSLSGSGITLADGTFYWWKVNATVSGQTSAFSNAVSFRTKTATCGSGPTAPTLYLPVQGATNQPITFNTFYWRKNAASDSVSYYNFYLASDRLFANVIWPVPQLADTVTGSGVTLNYLTWYYWHVNAVKQTCVGAFSVTDSFQTVAQAVPNAPTPLWPVMNAVNRAIDTVNIVWSQNNVATKYHLQVATDNTFGTNYIDLDLTTTSFQPGRGFLLTYNTIYYWRVNVTTGNGTSVYSQAQKFTTMQQPAAVAPAAPTLVSPTQGQTGLSVVTTHIWNTVVTDSARDFTFILGRKRNLDTTNLTGLDFVATTPAPTNTYGGSQVVGGLNYSTWYYWQVQTNKGATLKSVWSVVDSFQTGALIAEKNGAVLFPWTHNAYGGSTPDNWGGTHISFRYVPNYIPPKPNDTSVVDFGPSGWFKGGQPWTPPPVVLPLAQLSPGLISANALGNDTTTFPPTPVPSQPTDTGAAVQFKRLGLGMPPDAVTPLSITRPPAPQGLPLSSFMRLVAPTDTSVGLKSVSTRDFNYGFSKLMLSPDIDIDLGRTITIAGGFESGLLAGMVIRPPAYSSEFSSNSDAVATLFIAGQPSLGGGMSLSTPSYSLYASGPVYFTSDLTIGGTTIMGSTIYENPGPVNPPGLLYIDTLVILSDGTGRGRHRVIPNVATTGQVLVSQGPTVKPTWSSTGTPVASVDLTAQSASIGATTLYTPSAPGKYEIEWVATVTRVATTSSTLGDIRFTYTDGDDANGKIVPGTVITNVHNTSTNNVLTGVISGSFLIYSGGPALPIKYQIGYTSSGGTTMQYNLHIVLIAR